MDAKKNGCRRLQNLEDVLNQGFTEKIARFLVNAPTVGTAIWRQVRVTNANTASLDKALLQCDNPQHLELD